MVIQLADLDYCINRFLSEMYLAKYGDYNSGFKTPHTRTGEHCKEIITKYRDK